MDRAEPFSPPAWPAPPRRFRSFVDIVHRIEQVRAYTGLTKRRFCEAVGIRPQTYAAFVGGQQSKPNLELIHGVVTAFRVDPAWILSGRGTMFLAGSDDQPGWTPVQAQDMEGGPGAAQGMQPAGQRPPESEFGAPLWQHLEGIMDRLDQRHRPLLERLMRVLHGHANVNPAGVAGELKALLDFVELRLSQR